MSTAVFPALPGLQWEVTKTFEFKTQSQETQSGKEYRARAWVYPRRHYTLSYEFLRDDSDNNELKRLAGFFLARSGSFDNFNFLDPDDYVADNQLVSTGDGVTFVYQLVSEYGGYLEPVYRPIYDGGLLPNPESFVGWGLSNISLSSKWVVAPDGAQTAREIVENTVSNIGHFITYNPAATVGTAVTSRWFTFSAYVKRGTGSRNAILLMRQSLTANIDTQAIFNLSTGLLQTTSVDVGWSNASGTISSVGNGWYRISLTALLAPQATISNTHIRMCDSGFDSTYTGDGSSSIYIWGAKLELGRQLNSYISVPKIYKVGWQGTMLLSSATRYNKVTDSENFSAWSNSSLTVTANTNTAPDGTVTADTLTDSGGSFGTSTKSWTVSGSDDVTKYSLLLCVRKTTGGTSATVGINLDFSGGSTPVYNALRMNTDTGAILVTSGVGTWAVTSISTSWWKVTCLGAVNNTSGNTTLSMIVYPATGTYNSGVDDAAVTGSAVVWGAQLDVADFERSYHRTFGAEFAAVDYTISAEGLVTLAQAPYSGSQVRWSGGYYQRVCFKEDVSEYGKFMNKLWNAKKVELRTDK